MRYDEKVLELIVKKSYGQKLGARDIRRVIRNEVEDRISEIIVDKGDTGISAFAVSVQGDTIKVDFI
jgi:ATP-dependent Clp protease ATP-binding subunit ClpA